MTRWRGIVRWIVGVALGLWLGLASARVTIAYAQETGGSFGGGDWGDTGGGGGDWGGGGGWGGGGSDDTGGGSDWGSGGSDWGSSSSADDGGGSYGGRRSHVGSSDDDWIFWLGFAAVCVVVFGPFVLVEWRASRRRRQDDYDSFASSAPSMPRAQSPAWNGVDLTSLRLVLDWRARPFVQSELMRMARGGDTRSKEGLARLLQATARTLKSVEMAWLYAGAKNFRPMSPPQAQGIYRRMAQDARATFRQELVRADAGKVTTADAHGLRATEGEGPGVVLVTVLVAAKKEIVDFRPEDARDVKRLLDALERIGARELVALDVVWTPAADEDRMSTAELEALHSDLVRIGGIGGRVFCGYCSGPYPMELAKCPHCGAPNEGAPNERATSAGAGAGGGASS